MRKIKPAESPKTAFSDLTLRTRPGRVPVRTPKIYIFENFRKNDICIKFINRQGIRKFDGSKHGSNHPKCQRVLGRLMRRMRDTKVRNELRTETSSDKSRRRCQEWIALRSVSEVWCDPLDWKSRAASWCSTSQGLADAVEDTLWWANKIASSDFVCVANHRSLIRSITWDHDLKIYF